jgi:hypothetical protein
LGQTKETTNPETAINLFLEREFPQLLKYQTEAHEAFLIPDSFIYGGIAAKVILIVYLYYKGGGGADM